MPRARTPIPPAQRFWAKVEKSPDGCWLWTGALGTHGYGVFCLSPGRVVLAHRYAYEQLIGSIPEGMFACHKCDVRPCVRPDHIFIGDVTANNRDMAQKRRHARSNYTHCRRAGHPMTPDNTLLQAKGKYRRCKACAVEYWHQRTVRETAERRAAKAEKVTGDV